MENQTINNEPQVTTDAPTKFCKHCGEKIPVDAVICTKCGRQVEELKSDAAPQVVVNNNNENTSTNTNINTNTNLNTNTDNIGKPRNKWVALLLCLFFGFVGAHKFYEGKIGMGILYIFTFGLCCFGAIIDFFVILFKPNPYYVK